MEGCNQFTGGPGHERIEDGSMCPHTTCPTIDVYTVCVLTLLNVSVSMRPRTASPTLLYGSPQSSGLCICPHTTINACPHTTGLYLVQLWVSMCPHTTIGVYICFHIQ